MVNPVLLTETKWYGQPAYQFETEAMRVVTTPQMGAKIVSVFDKRAGHEWLLPPIDRPFKPTVYGARFVDQDMSGWDEMMPSIDAGAYPAEGKFAGVALPDHGEVWSVPWTVVEVQTDALTLDVQGQALPYRFRRTMRVISPTLLRMEYEVLRTAPDDFVVLWAAHPQFVVDAETHIVLPDEVETITNILNVEELGAPGLIHAWPETKTPQGEPFALDQIGSRERHKYRKLYLSPHQPVAWAAMRQGEAGQWLRLGWDAQLVPYLGIWVDEGAVNTVAAAALEPSNGFYDTLERAWNNQRVLHVNSDQPYRWYMDIEIGRGAL